MVPVVAPVVPVAPVIPVAPVVPVMPPPPQMYIPPPPPPVFQSPPPPPPTVINVSPTHQRQPSGNQNKLKHTPQAPSSLDLMATPRTSKPTETPKTVVTIKGKKCSSSMCHTCGEETGITTIKKVGFVAVIWCLVLSNVALCCIPLCTDKCKDTVVLCSDCKTKKTKIEADCC